MARARTAPAAGGKKKKFAPKPKPTDAAAVVRMYRHGLGDCFLLRFPREGKRDFRVLIDCGVIQGTPEANAGRGGKGTRKLVEIVADDLAAACTDPGNEKPVLDVLVATHEHWDHVSGFAQATGTFDEFEIGQVWLAWTENPHHPVATRLRRERAERVNALRVGLAHARNELAAAGQSELTDAVLDRAAGVLSFFGVDPESGSGLGATGADDPLFGAAGKPKLTVAEAMEWCRGRAAKAVRYWNPGDVINHDELPGVKVHVLGPPTDLKQLHKDSPTAAGQETYHLAAAGRTFFGADVGQGGGAQDDFERSAPFDCKYRIGMNDAAETDFFRTHYFGTGAGTAEPWRRIDAAGLTGAARFALKLDEDTNNTSLALAFELADGRVLLFPGDAQVGNWESWHKTSTGEMRDWPDGDTRRVTAKALLAKTVVYKVGHHASHNATLRDAGLEMMTDPDLVAFVPVDTYVAHELKRWRRMPFEPLLAALRRRAYGRVIAADRPVSALKPDAAFPGGPPVDSAEEVLVEQWDAKPVPRPLYVEYAVPRKGRA